MVILLITGPPGAGKEELASFLKEKYGYHPLKVKHALVTNCWDFTSHKPIESYKETVLAEIQKHIEYALEHWNEDTIIYPIQFPESVESITKKRSYFRLLGIVGPIQKRYERFVTKQVFLKEKVTKEEFIEMDDYMNFEMGISECLGKVEFQILNNKGLAEFIEKIEEHTLITGKIFRPSWDQYFMKIAHIVRQRSNCMKRSVGAVLTQENRIISTGYNGTPGKLINCYQGGCERCNLNKGQGEALDKCVCIHAEENTILECGVQKARGGTIYTTLAPCRWCTKVLIQAQIARVVYDQKYSDRETDKLFEKAGIIVDCVSIDF